MPDGVDRSLTASESESRFFKVEIAETATPVVDDETMLKPNPMIGIIIMMLMLRLCAKISIGPVKLMLVETEEYISSAKDFSRGIVEEIRKTVEKRKTVMGKRPHFVWRNEGNTPLS
jgi:hypothetical protein